MDFTHAEEDAAAALQKAVSRAARRLANKAPIAGVRPMSPPQPGMRRLGGKPAEIARRMELWQRHRR